MGETMLASEMTDGQIDDLANKLRDAARKHRDEIEKDPAQEALRSDNIGMVLFATFRKLTEELSKRIVHVVTVDRKRTPKAALKASGRNLYVTDSVVEDMPRGTGDKVKLVYFKLDRSEYAGHYPTCRDVERAYENRCVVPDPQAQIDDNAANFEFADSTPNACQWKDKDGNWCYATFYRWNDERNVHVYRNANDWNDYWSFAGVPQGSVSSDT